MIRRLLLLLAVSAVLTALLLSSQWRQEPLHVSGFIEADEIRLGSRVGGRVAKVYVQEGDRVQAGAPLVDLEPYDLRSREKEAESGVAECQAELDRLNSSYRDQAKAQAEAHVQQWQAQLELLRQLPLPEEKQAAWARLEVAEAQLRLAQQTFDRVKALFDKQTISKSEFDSAVEDLKVAENLQIVRKQEWILLDKHIRESAEVKRAEAQRAEAQAAWELADKGYRKEEQDKAQAALLAAQAKLDAIRTQLVELTIRAPGGDSATTAISSDTAATSPPPANEYTVEAMELQPGDMVLAGAPVLSLVDSTRLWVRAYVPGASGVHVGQSVKVTVDGLPGGPLTGQVVFRARQAEFTPSNVQTIEERSEQVFRIKVALEPREGLWPGMTADVWLPSAAESQP